MNATTETISALGHTSGVNIFRGLMWRHWLAGRWAIVGGLVVLLAGGWALMLFHHPGWIIATGSIFAAISGIMFGGTDASDGSEEFAFALPPTRSQRYISGIVLGGGAVLAYCLIGTMSIALDLPQFLWSLVVDSGFTTPFGPWVETYLYFLAIVVPLLVFACTHICASLSQTRGAVWLSWLPAVGITGLVVWLGCMAEDEIWGRINGYICVPALLAMGAMFLLFGHTRYVRKEGISRPGGTTAGGGSWWIWIIMAVIVVFLLMMSLYAWRVSYDSSPYPMKQDFPPRGSNAAASVLASRPVHPTTQEADEAADTERALIEQQRAEARAMAEAEADAVATERAMRTGSSIALSVPGVMLLVILLVTVLVLVRRRHVRPMRLRGPRKRHIVTRSVCAVLAVAILASIGFFSWREAGAVYATESTGPGSIRIPTKKAAALTVELKPNQNVPLTEARLLIRAVVMETTTATSFRAVRTDEFDIAWRSGKNSAVSNSFKLGKTMISYRLNIDRVYVQRSDNSTEAGVQGDGNWDMRVNYVNRNAHSSSSGGVYITNGMAIAQNIWNRDPHGDNKPLSVVPPIAEYGQLILCVFVDLADADDKLAKIPVGQFITERHAEILTRASRQGRSGSSSRRWRVDPEVPPTIKLIEHIGFSSMLLGLAAVLLAQLFMRRGLATVAMLATVVLYVAAIDRIALGMHISYARDTEVPLSKRLIACRAVTNTFFFAKTASSQLRTIADDQLSPEALQHRAGRGSILLGAIADTGKAAGDAWTLRTRSTNVHMSAQTKDGHEKLRWQITVYYVRRNRRPLMVAVQALPGHSRHDELGSRMLRRVIFSQVDATGRIVVVGPSLRAVVTGNENDMVQAAWASQHGRLVGSDIWTRLILPTAKRLTND